ncbi:hypothetical protein QCA50_014789 [Cerrena zonata]|uniref:J domain-containing protein n=1 Tax=Cerrena zonata TaxID=2478898 RepID=A0AAW0FSD1_9APHY
MGFDNERELYTLFGADPTWTDERILRVWRRMAAQAHPDKGGDPEYFKELK